MNYNNSVNSSINNKSGFKRPSSPSTTNKASIVNIGSIKLSVNKPNWK